MQGYNKFENSSETPQEVLVHSPPQQYPGQQYSPPQPMIIHEVEQPWGWGTMVLSGFSFFCCQLFGLIAIVSSLTAYSDHRVKDYAGALRKRNMARGFGIAAIAIGIMVAVGTLILIVNMNEKFGDMFSEIQKELHPTPSPDALVNDIVHDVASDINNDLDLDDM